MGYKQNNPLPRMKSALKMEKEMKKGGMHRDSAMYMNSPMYSGHSPMEMAKHDSPMYRESAEEKYMPIVDIEKGDAKGDRKDARQEQPKSKREYGSPAKAAKPDYIDIDGDGDKSESMKDAAKDKKGSPAKKYDRVVLGGNKGDKSKTKPGKKDFEGKGSPAKKYDKVVLGGNKGDKSKTKPGKKDYEKGSPAKKEGMSKKEAKDLGRMVRTAQGKATKKDERKNKRDTKKTMRHVKKHGSGLKMD